MNQTEFAPDAVASIILDGVVSALNTHPAMAATPVTDRARNIRTAIGAFHPEGATDLMLAGQSLLFNGLIADSSRDVFTGAAGLGKQRALANINALNRSLHQNLATFVRRMEIARVNSAAGREEAQAAMEAAPERAPEPEVPESWLDEPFITWVAETPAEEVARLAQEAAEEPIEVPSAPEPAEAPVLAAEPEIDGTARATEPEVAGTGQATVPEVAGPPRAIAPMIAERLDPAKTLLRLLGEAVNYPAKGEASTSPLMDRGGAAPQPD